MSSYNRGRTKKGAAAPLMGGWLNASVARGRANKRAAISKQQQQPPLVSVKTDFESETYPIPTNPPAASSTDTEVIAYSATPYAQRPLLILVGLVFFLLFVAVLTYIIYDLATLQHVNAFDTFDAATNISSSTANLRPRKKGQPSPAPIPGQPHLPPVAPALPTVVTEHIVRKMLIKVLTSVDIISQYRYKPSISRAVSATTNFLYQLYQIGHTVDGNNNYAQCKPIWSSLEHSCCCFIQNLDRMLCHDDEFVQIKTAEPGTSTPNQTTTSTYQITCELIYGSTSSGIEHHHAESKSSTGVKQWDIPRVYMGLSSDYLDSIYKLSLLAAKNNSLIASLDECTIKLNFMCLQ